MASARTVRTESADFTSPRTLRSPSSASDMMSSSARSSAGVLPSANTRPAYIAQSAADQLASTELDRSVSISEPALELVNSFLDQILFNLLALSKSTNLTSIRPSVIKLLKPRLGQVALNAADEELSELMDDEGLEALSDKNEKHFNPKDFDVELAWKLARLRCMVYSRLGDVEEEDEEEFLEQENLDEHDHNPQMSASPTSALFLASVLEFLGEQAICISAQIAERKHNHNLSKQLAAVEQDSDATLTIETSDVLQLGREGPLSRLWRGWRRDTRASEPFFSSRPTTPGQVKSPVLGEGTRSRANSEAVIPEESPSNIPMTPSQIPLPMRERDVDEIEVPGLAPEFEEREMETEPEIPERSKRRPSSMLVSRAALADEQTHVPLSSQEEPGLQSERPHWTRSRSQSLPTPAQSPFKQPVKTTNRDTMIYSPDQAQSVRDSLKQQGIEDIEQTDKEQTQLNEATDAEHKGAKQGIISGTIGAIAGALGVEALRSARNSQVPRGAETSASQPEEHSKKVQTVAEQMIGPSSTVKPPTNAETGANIRDFGDFSSMHVPPGKDTPEIPEPEKPEQVQEVSDPEDLALSSGDEDGAVQSHEPDFRDSGFIAEPVSRPTTAEQNMVYRPSAASPISSASSPSSPRRNREASVIGHTVIPMREEVEEIAPPPPPIKTEAKSKSTASSKRHSVMFTENERPASGTEQTSAWPAVVPPRRASREQQIIASHSPTLSKSSQYSHHSKTSSTGKAFVNAREQDVRPSSLEQQRAVFNDAPTQSFHSRTTSGSRELSQPSGPLAKRRERLHLSMDSEEDAKVDEEKKKSLEILIKSDETLHYTLTPVSARANDWSQASGKPKTQTQELADFFRNTGPPGDTTVPGTARSARQPANGLRANPPNQSQPAVGEVNEGTTPRIDQLQSKGRNPLGEPRDARPERNTTRDLADYARSTGPNTDEQLPKALGTRPNTSSGKDRAAVGGLGPNGVPRAPTVGAVSIDPNPGSDASNKPNNRLKFQARDARPARNADTAELIDFIREGPPRETGDHRIDRKVAPFRTTMDSDDLNALAPPPESYARDSVASTQDSSVTRSVQESTNSRTALLDTQRNGTARTPNGVSSLNGVARQTIPEMGQAPQRKRRAPKDPYAIDFSDDEVEEPVVKPQRQEESLIDFLRNTSPPPGMTTKPILAAAQRAEEKKEQELKRSVSNSKLKDVLTRTTSQRNGTAPKGSLNSSSTAKPSIVAREESPHLTQVGSKMDKYRPTQTTHAAHVDRNRVNRPKAEARDATRGGSSTAELADYLRNSGPPEPVKPPSEQRVPASKDQASFMKFFQKRAPSVRQ